MSNPKNQPLICFHISSSPVEYYKAELLLLSLAQFAHHPKQQVLILLSEIVDEKFIRYLNDKNYHYKIIKSDSDTTALIPRNALHHNTDMFVLGKSCSSSSEPFDILHCKDLLTPFGIFTRNKTTNKSLLKRIDTANQAISAHGQFTFFSDYKKSLITPPAQTKQSITFGKELNSLLKPIKQPLKLIIHAGTPKTGTTSLQVYLDKKQRKLRGKGILYPHHLHNPHAPKHQWLEKNLIQTHPLNLLENFKSILTQVDENTHTILLSSEGVYNHWWDLPEESKALLVELNKRLEIEIWVWFREPLAFIESFYKQCIRNPQVRNISCYGKDLSFSEMLEDEWFTQHLDYLGFINECQALFGEDSVSQFRYEKDIVPVLSEMLGLATPHDNPTPRKNPSLNAASVEVLRVINRYGVKAKDKERLIPHLKEINNVIDGYSAKTIIDEDSKTRILEMVALSKNITHTD